MYRAGVVYKQVTTALFWCRLIYIRYRDK